MLRKLAFAVFVVVAMYTAWAMSYGWTWFDISLFDFWAFQMVFLSSAYLLVRWDEFKGRSMED